MDNKSKALLLEEVRRDIEEMETDLAGLRAVEAYLLRPVQEAQPTVTQTAIATTANSPLAMAQFQSEPVNRSLNADPGRFRVVTSIADAAMTIINEAGHGLRAGEIADALLAGGYPVSGENRDNPRAFANTVFSALTRRNDRFFRPQRGLWSIRFQQNGTGDRE